MKDKIYSEEFKTSNKEKSQDFTRNRSLGFEHIIFMLLNRITKSLSVEILNFLEIFETKFNIKLGSYTKSAFCKARMKLKYEAFVELNDELVKRYYTEDEEYTSIKTWNNYRLIAIDGSQMHVPKSKETEAYFGNPSNNHGKSELVKARCSVLYDVINRIALSSILAPLEQGEKTLAKQQLKNLQKGKDLFIGDRAYPSFDLIYHLDKQGIDYVIRASVVFNKAIKNFVKSNKYNKIIELKPNLRKLSGKEYDKNSSIKVRLIKVILDDGEIEILVSSLKDIKTYPHTEFKGLYYLRWKIETYYDELKNKMKIEQFSGYSVKSVLQDFHSTVLVSNFQSIMVEELEEDITQKTKNRQYKYKVNNAVSYGIMKNRILNIFFGTNEKDSIEAIQKEMIKYLEPIRSDRKYPIDIRKYRRKIKPKVTKNQRDNL